MRQLFGFPFHASRYRKNTGLKLDPWIWVWHIVHA
jgi:hypothetical protein